MAPALPDHGAAWNAGAVPTAGDKDIESSDHDARAGEPRPMRVRVLGSAAGGGFPQWNCNCRLCEGVRTGSIRARARTQSSIAVTSDGCDWILFNASPDILQQRKANPELQPARALRDTGIRAIVLMDAQIDHTTGLLMLRESADALPLWCTAQVHEDLSTGNPLLGVLAHYAGVDWHELRPGAGAVAIPGADGIDFTPLALTSNAPPYSPRRDAPVPGDTLGMLMVERAGGRRLFYAPGLGAPEPHVIEAMATSDVVLVDGTMWSDEEMIACGASAKTARSMGHLPQSGDGGMLEWLGTLPPTTRRVLIHINNTNPILDEDGPERTRLNELGIEVAYDGMDIAL